jgi:hypothetical protein
MAEFWLDPSAPTHGSGTFESPFRDLTTIGGENILNIKRGTTHRQPIDVDGSGSLAAPLLIRAYGDPSLRRPLLHPSTGTACIGINGRSHVHMEDMEWTVQVGQAIALYVFGSAPTACQNIRVSRVRAFECVGDQNWPEFGNGIAIFTTAIDGGPVKDVLIEDFEVDGCSNHGIATYGSVDGVTVRRSRVANCSRVYAGHGATSYAHRVEVAGSSLALVTGTRYSVTLPAIPGVTGTVNTVYRVIRRAGTSVFELTGAGATTTPAVGQCGFSGGVLYFNFGEAVASDDVLVVFVQQCKNILYEDCIFERTRNPSGIEGAGLQFDDGAEGIARRCISRNNDGYGIVSNLGANCIFENNIVHDNATGGILTSIGSGSRADFNTVLRNGPYGIRMWYPASSQFIRNNVIVGHDVAIRGHSGVTAGNNAVWQNVSTATDGVSPTGTVTTDPRLAVSGAPMAGSPLIGAAAPITAITRDFRRVQRRKAPTIGAFEPATLRRE